MRRWTVLFGLALLILTATAAAQWTGPLPDDTLWQFHVQIGPAAHSPFIWLTLSFGNPDHCHEARRAVIYVLETVAPAARVTDCQ